MEKLHNFVQSWLPNTLGVFLLLSLVQSLSTIYFYISDCDETFNYWEPTHFLQYRKGLQTWEYSPDYALRSYVLEISIGLALILSYAYLYPQYLIGLVSSYLGFSKLQQFYVIRFFLGIFCSASLTYFYRSISAPKVATGMRMKPFLPTSPVLSFLTLFFLLVSTGLFIAGNAYLPSTFAMNFLTVSQAAWMNHNYPLAIFSVAIASIIGWPFCAFAGLPLALYVLYDRSLWYLLKWSIVSGLLCLVPSVLIDSYHYNKLVIAPLNIVLYNVFSGGSELYGVEPWYYYIMNGFLNFNFVLFFALAVVAILVLHRALRSSASEPVQNFYHPLLIHSPMLIWFAFMSAIAHKEERFLFVIYPQIAFAGAYSIYLLVDLCYTLKLKPKYTQVLLILILAVVFLASVSRSVNLVKNYNGAFSVYTDLSLNSDSYGNGFKTNYDRINVCVGKEWYRFPNSYFFPNPRYNLTFFRQVEKNSQLPQYFGSSTSEVQANFNDKNADELSRYIPLADCHYLIDMDSDEKREIAFGDENWKLLSKFPFIDSSASPTLTRAFYIPFYSAQKNFYNSYFLLLNKHK